MHAAQKASVILVAAERYNTERAEALLFFQSRVLVEGMAGQLRCILGDFDEQPPADQEETFVNFLEAHKDVFLRNDRAGFFVPALQEIGMGVAVDRWLAEMSYTFGG